MSITLTEKAASEVKKIITDQKLEDGTVLRVGVAGGEGRRAFVRVRVGVRPQEVRARPVSGGVDGAVR